MIYYAIKHKPSNTYFPLFKSGQRRGSTYIKLPFTGPPRLFTTKVAAKNCLRWWLAGTCKLEYDGGEDGGHYVVGASPGKGDPLRNPVDMEIVEIVIS